MAPAVFVARGAGVDPAAVVAPGAAVHDAVAASGAVAPPAALVVAERVVPAGAVAACVGRAPVVSAARGTAPFLLLLVLFVLDLAPR